MKRSPRWLAGVVVAAVVVLASPFAALAASITGIMIYSTEDFGDPSGTTSEPTNPEVNLWMSGAHPKWFLLGVYEGMAPQSLLGRTQPRPLNGASFNVNLPLIDGENVFTVVGQPAPTTVNDNYQHLAVNLYFDGISDLPGISVLFSPQAPIEGGETTRSRAQYIYAFGASLAKVRVPGVDDHEGFDSYDDGVVRVTVPSASMLNSARVEAFDPDGGLDLMSTHNIQKSGITNENPADFVGTITVFVEPSSGNPTNPVVPGFVPGPGGIL